MDVISSEEQHALEYGGVKSQMFRGLKLKIALTKKSDPTKPIRTDNKNINFCKLIELFSGHVSEQNLDYFHPPSLPAPFRQYPSPAKRFRQLKLRERRGV